MTVHRVICVRVADLHPKSAITRVWSTVTSLHAARTFTTFAHKIDRNTSRSHSLHGDIHTSLIAYSHAGASRGTGNVISRVCDRVRLSLYVFRCLLLKEIKTARAINTKVGRDIQYRTGPRHTLTLIQKCQRTRSQDYQMQTRRVLRRSTCRYDCTSHFLV